MLMMDYTAKFLDLKDVIITNIENISDQLYRSIELPRKAVSPCCGMVTDRVHAYRMQVIKIEGCNNKTKVLKRITVCVTSIISEIESSSAIHNIVPEQKLRHDLKVILFCSAPTIDIEPLKGKPPVLFRTELVV